MKCKSFVTLAVLLLFVGMVFVSCKGDTADRPDPARRPALTAVQGLDFLPAETVFVASVDWAAISGLSAFESEVQEARKTIEDELGIDVFKDLNSIAIGLSTFDNDIMDQGIIILNGSFDENVILGAMRDHEDFDGIRETVYNNVTIYTPQDGSEELSFAFIGRNNVLLSSEANIKKSIDVNNKKHPSIKENKTLVNAFKAIKPGAHLMGAGIFDENFKGQFAGDPMTSSLANIDILTLSAVLDESRFELELTGKCGEESQAREMYNTINGLWEGMGKPMMMTDPSYRDFADIIKINHSGPDVILTITLEEHHIEAIRALTGDTAY